SRLVPSRAPVGDHRGEQRRIVIRSVGVTLALIPDKSLRAVGNERGDHAVEKHGGNLDVPLRRTPEGERSRAGFLRGAGEGEFLVKLVKAFIIIATVRRGPFGERGEARQGPERLKTHPDFGGRAA